MNICIEKIKIDLNTKQEIEKLLGFPQQNRTDLEQMWYLMDKVWDEYGCDNKKLNWNRIAKFYSHPVWLLNGIFIEHHELSMQHREAISAWVAKCNFRRIVDYGGGHGTLARSLAKRNLSFLIDIYEPHPSKYAIEEIKRYPNIQYVAELSNYDCLISTDVIEHVPDPLITFSQMIKSINMHGFLIIANNFSPVIKCHLPQTFHLKYTFNQFAKIMGLSVIGRLSGSHALIFKKVASNKKIGPKIRFYEYVSKKLYPINKFSRAILRPVKRFFAR